MKCIYQQKYVRMYILIKVLTKQVALYVSGSILVALFTTLMPTQVAVSHATHLDVLQQISSVNRLRGQSP